MVDFMVDRTMGSPAIALMIRLDAKLIQCCIRWVAL